MPVNPHLFVLFLLTTSAAMISPGPDMLFVLGCGMRGGPRAGLAPCRVDPPAIFGSR